METDAQTTPPHHHHHHSQPPLMESPLPQDPRRPPEQEQHRRSDLSKPGRPSGSERPAFIGKHKLAASISALQTQITLIQDELKELETTGESSLVCKEILSSVESVPDPLIPETRGPAGSGWDLWFRGDHHPRRRKRWI
ncbi:hypothetical protein MLD38_013295 [Melastoma candidum]|uniref:Uncharacterized protein n=1 Tax=Melastoma candidum TaxID=119954 RepID=A0ACB9R977_9MYRT|nr:hypothetical protein MLD38_013295 [Melastoma candidum]